MSRWIGPVSALAALTSLAAGSAVGKPASAPRPQATKPAAGEPAPAPPGALDDLLQSHALERTTNPVAAGFVLDEGASMLPDSARGEASSQLQKALLAQLDPIHNLLTGAMSVMDSDAMDKAMKQAQEEAKPKNIIKSMLGFHKPQPQPDQMQQAQQAQQAKQAIVDPWIRGLAAASALDRLGQPKAAAQFYVDCFQFVAQDWMPGLCLDQLLAMGPKRSSVVLQWMLRDAEKIGYAGMSQSAQPPGAAGAPNPVAVNLRSAALEGLGALAGDATVPADERAAALSAVLGYAQGKENAPYYAAAARGLGRARDPQAIPLLREMVKSSKRDPAARQAALDALAGVFSDPSALDALRDQAKDERNPDRALHAARVLFAAGDDESIDRAVSVIDDRRSADAPTPDLRPEIVRELAEAGGGKGKAALARALAGGPGNDWLGAWIRVTLLETGDASQLSAVQADVAKEDWTLDRRGVLSVFRQVLQTAEMVMAGSHLDAVRAIYNFAAAQRQEVLAKAEKRRTLVARLRWQAADAVAATRPTGGLALVTGLLDDSTPAVRLSAAAALARLASPDALDAMARAYALDYGAEKGIPRAPEVKAMLVRAAASAAPTDPRTHTLLVEASRSDEPATRLIAIAHLAAAPSSARAN